MLNMQEFMLTKCVFYIYSCSINSVPGFKQAYSADSFLPLQHCVNMQHKGVNDLLAGDPSQRSHGEILWIL